jgi:hypothetical protein
MLRFNLLKAWRARFVPREDLTLRRFDSLRTAPATTRVAVFLPRKAA